MRKTIRKPWTRKELILAINLYCKTPFGKIHIRNPEIIELAKQLGRTPGAVSYKLANFASLDPSLSRKGASHSSKLDQEIWNEFFENWEAMSFESEMSMANLKGEKVEFSLNKDIKGEMKETVVKKRINQNFFRKMILSSYNNTCCITGMSISDLLIASHIVPWSKDEKCRLNPRNGLCLNALHDRAFDKGLITISEDFRVLISPLLRQSNKNNRQHELITNYADKQIILPNRFLPDQKFLDYHRKNIFRNKNREIW